MTKIIAEVKVEQPIEAIINRHIIVGRVSHTGGNSVQKLSELENDTGYITEEAIPKDLSEFNNDSDFITLEEVPPIPTKTSELTNDSDFITSEDIPDTQIQSDWSQADNSKKDFIKNKPTQLSQFINNLPKTAKFDILESDSPKKVTLSQTPMQDDFTGYNLFIINTGDNSVFLPQGTNYMFPNINGLDIDINGKEVTINSDREFDGAVLAFYLVDGATNEDIFQFKFMLMGMISSSLLSGHFGMKLSSLKTTAKNYIEAINELKKGLDDTTTPITELTYDYALTEKYRYIFTRDANGVIINIDKELL